VAYEDWTPEFQELWDSLPVDMDALTSSELEYTEYMFEEGFMHYEGEQSPLDTEFARNEFFDMIDYDYDYFDWEGWREAMGYND
jgi:hypothetical protein